MDSIRQVKISKYLSKHLRHQPKDLGLLLEPGGWVLLDDLMLALERRNFFVTREEIFEVIAKSDKQRFSLNEDQTKIRANQGHTVAVDLQLESLPPPEILYHGTGEKSAASILERGLQKMQRHHVHLSADTETAIRVGRRHGRPVIFEIAAEKMAQSGFDFFCSTNGVWLVEMVPPTYLQIISNHNHP